MNTKSLITVLSIIALSSCVWSCKDKETDPDPIPTKPPVTEEQLPPITTTGAGTFGCKVNGKVWLAKTNNGWPTFYSSFNRNADNTITITGNLITNNTYYKTGILFYFKGDTIVYKLNYYEKNNQVSSAYYYDINNNITSATDSLRMGELSILRFDSVNQIISGTFFFDCINKQTGEVLKITDGRFDGHYTY